MDMKQRLNKLGTALNIEVNRIELTALQQSVSGPGFWDDSERAAKISQRVAELDKLIKEYDTLHVMASEGSKEEIWPLISDDVKRLEQQALLSGKYDQLGAICAIHAGAGGTDAQDWAEMLLRMYLRWVERAKIKPLIIDRSNWKAELVDVARGDEAGIKNATFIVKGSYAYGLLKNEAGVHRLVRQSPFNAKGLRQTSFALLDVIPEITEQKIKIADKDIRIDVYRSSGPGGQSVNTTDSAVRVTHTPTGITAAVQDEKSQLKNKVKALNILYSRLEAKMEQEQSDKIESLRGDLGKNEWGSQIRSYVLHPYKQVKDHRTGTTESNTDAVLDGDIDKFVQSKLEQE